MTHADFSHLLSSLESLSSGQMRRLRQLLDSQLAEPTTPRVEPTAKRGKPTKAAGSKKKPLTVDEFNRRLLAEGRLASLPDPALDIDDDDPDDQPIAIEGEPLSETIIRERR